MNQEWKLCDEVGMGRLRIFVFSESVIDVEMATGSKALASSSSYLQSASQISLL